MFPAFYGTRRFATVFTRSSMWFLTQARWILFKTFLPISLRYVLILSSDLHSGIFSGLFLQVLQQRCFHLVFYIFHTQVKVATILSYHLFFPSCFPTNSCMLLARQFYHKSWHRNHSLVGCLIFLHNRASFQWIWFNCSQDPWLHHNEVLSQSPRPHGLKLVWAWPARTLDRGF
jgi:hypothetical protein